MLKNTDELENKIKLNINQHSQEFNTLRTYTENTYIIYIHIYITNISVFAFLSKVRHAILQTTFLFKEHSLNI